MSTALDFTRYDPLAPEMQRNPFPWYAALREHAPVELGEALRQLEALGYN